MPIVTIINWRAGSFDKHSKVTRAIHKAVLSMKVLCLTKSSDVTVVYGPVCSYEEMNPDVPLIIEITKLYAKPERTKEVCDELAKRVGVAFNTATFDKYGNNRKIEVFVELFDTKNNGIFVGY